MKLYFFAVVICLIVVLLSGSMVQAGQPMAMQLAPDQCEPLPPPLGNIINVASAGELVSAVNTTNPGV